MERFPENQWDWRYLECTAYYTVAGMAYSLWDIHNGVLRHNRPSPGGVDLPFYPDDPRINILTRTAPFNPLCSLSSLCQIPFCVPPLLYVIGRQLTPSGH